MLDPAREAELERYLHQFCNHALRERKEFTDGSSILDATIVVHSVLADAAERWNAAQQVNNMPSRAFLSFFDALPCSERIQVARVCRHWRKAATSQPLLWSRLILSAKRHYLDPKDDNFVFWANPGFLRQVLVWSGGHILDLTVYGIFGIYVDAFCDAYPGLSNRLCSLCVDFVVSYMDVERIGTVLSVPSPLLQHLTVTCGTGSAGPDGIPLRPPFAAPCLRSLSLMGCSLSNSMDLLPSVVKLTVGRGSATASGGWTKSLFKMFPNLDELNIPNYGEAHNFPTAPGPSCRLRSLSIGSERPGDKLLHLPPYRFIAIPHVRLFWPSHKVAKDLLAGFTTVSPRILSIRAVTPGRGYRLSLSAADKDFRCECIMDERDLNRVLPALSLPAVTTMTISDQCFPDPTWNLISSLSALTHLTFLVSGSPFRRMLTYVDSPTVRPSPPHPSLRSVTIKDDKEYYGQESGSWRGPQSLPSVLAADVERILISRLPASKSSDGRSNTPEVFATGVVIKDGHSRALGCERLGVRNGWAIQYDQVPVTYVALE